MMCAITLYIIFWTEAYALFTNASVYAYMSSIMLCFQCTYDWITGCSNTCLCGIYLFNIPLLIWNSEAGSQLCLNSAMEPLSWPPDVTREFRLKETWGQTRSAAFLNKNIFFSYGLTRYYFWM